MHWYQTSFTPDVYLPLLRVLCYSLFKTVWQWHQIFLFFHAKVIKYLPRGFTPIKWIFARGSPTLLGFADSAFLRITRVAMYLSPFGRWSSFPNIPGMILEDPNLARISPQSKPEEMNHRLLQKIALSLWQSSVKGTIPEGKMSLQFAFNLKYVLNFFLIPLKDFMCAIVCRENGSILGAIIEEAQR